MPLVARGRFGLLGCRSQRRFAAVEWFRSNAVNIRGALWSMASERCVSTRAPLSAALRVSFSTRRQV